MPDKNPPPPSLEEPSLADVLRATRTLSAVRVAELDPRVRLELTRAAGLVVARPARGPRRVVRAPRPPSTPSPPQTRCAICRQRFVLVDRAAARVCAACLDAESRRRTAFQAEVATGALAGKIALVTGGRIRLGKRTVLALLRAGARVVTTTRFPQVARAHYALEADFAAWRDRLEVVGLDLMRLDDVEGFARALTVPHLDLVVHNAAQTVKKPPDLYAPLFALEDRLEKLLPAAASSSSSPPSPFPLLPGDADGEPPDTRADNSWTHVLDDVPTGELVEVLAVNAAAPFALTRALLPLLAKSPSARRFVVCVTSREGQFHVDTKMATHPHTNMAKAALNMMVRTCAPTLEAAGTTLVAVDPGWFSEQRAVDDRRTLPITLDDAVARVLHPVLDGLARADRPPAGVLYRDYAVAPW